MKGLLLLFPLIFLLIYVILGMIELLEGTWFRMLLPLAIPMVMLLGFTGIVELIVRVEGDDKDYFD